MAKKKNIFLEKLSEDEVKAVNGGAWKCPPFPSYIRPGNSSAYLAWLHANCKPVSSCTPSTWSQCR